MSAKQKVIYLHSTENTKLVQAVAKYTRDAFEARDNNFNTRLWLHELSSLVVSVTNVKLIVNFLFL